MRSDLCSASLQVGRAAMAILFEPTPDGEIRVTAQAGAEPAIVGLTLGPDDSLARLLQEGRQHLQNEIVADHWDSPHAAEMWELSGRPDAILFQPLLRGTEPVGLLCVGWYDVLALSGPRVTAIGLLTHEAALLMTRADQMTRLAGMVTTDPLTGLANRRAWESKLAQAAMQPGPVTIAMIDLDKFKTFNDTYGHIAGDSLLRETADAWLAQLRDRRPAGATRRRRVRAAALRSRARFRLRDRRATAKRRDPRPDLLRGSGAAAPRRDDRIGGPPRRRGVVRRESGGARSRPRGALIRPSQIDICRYVRRPRSADRVVQHFGGKLYHGVM